MQDPNEHTPLTPLEAEETYAPTFSKKFLVEIDETCRSVRTRLAVLLALEEGDFAAAGCGYARQQKDGAQHRQLNECDQCGSHGQQRMG